MALDTDFSFASLGMLMEHGLDGLDTDFDALRAIWDTVYMDWTRIYTDFDALRACHFSKTAWLFTIIIQQNYNFAANKNEITVQDSQNDHWAIPLRSKHWYSNTELALEWLANSQDATQSGGFAHSYHPIFGWAKAYPETTGYLIETLCDYEFIEREVSLFDRALKAAIWLKYQQLDSGAYPGLLVGNTRPSVFNTSQILFGLRRILLELENQGKGQQADLAPHFIAAINKAGKWMLSIIEPDGAWNKAGYINNFTPAYYARALWPLLLCEKYISNPAFENLTTSAFEFYRNKLLPNGAVKGWGFYPGKPSFTHTIAYTLEGLWECGRIFRDAALCQTMEASVLILWRQHLKYGKTAGTYDEQFKGNYSFLCLTGNAQLSALCSKMFIANGNTDFKSAALGFLIEILPFQNGGANAGKRGALPGSAPVWGPYMRFRYPNWGVKFFLDALKYEDPWNEF